MYKWVYKTEPRKVGVKSLFKKTFFDFRYISLTRSLLIPSRRFLPYPRFPLPDDKYAYIVCVYDKPRIQYCGEYSYFDEHTLTCVYEEQHPHHVAAAAPHFGGGFGR